MYYLVFAFSLLLPLAMFIIGLKWYIKPPAFKASGIVYRTEATERSPEIWDFAHKYLAKLWARFGLIFLVITVVLLVVFAESYQKFILWLLCAQALILCVTVFMIEIFLKNLFDENGTRIY